MAIPGKKTEDQLILEDKIDENRAKIGLKARRWVRRAKNESEWLIRTEHVKQMKAGKVRELGD